MTKRTKQQIQKRKNTTTLQRARLTSDEQIDAWYEGFQAAWLFSRVVDRMRFIYDQLLFVMNRPIEIYVAHKSLPHTQQIEFLRNFLISISEHEPMGLDKQIWNLIDEMRSAIQDYHRYWLPVPLDEIDLTSAKAAINIAMDFKDGVRKLMDDENQYHDLIEAIEKQESAAIQARSQYMAEHPIRVGLSGKPADEAVNWLCDRVVSIAELEGLSRADASEKLYIELESDNAAEPHKSAWEKLSSWSDPEGTLWRRVDRRKQRH